MKRILIILVILTIVFTSVIAQKMDTLSIVGKWSSIDKVNMRRMTFYFGEDLKASMSCDGESIPLAYSLTIENSNQLLILITPEKRYIDLL